MDGIAFGALTMLPLMLLVGGVLCLTAYLFKSMAFRESGVGMSASRSDIVYGVVVLAIWVLIHAGLFGWFNGRPPIRWGFRVIELPWLAVTSYTVLVLAFVVRKGLYDIPAAYRERKRQRGEARRDSKMTARASADSPFRPEVARSWGSKGDRMHESRSQVDVYKRGRGAQ
jgi:hypothetical protein